MDLKTTFEQLFAAIDKKNLSKLESFLPNSGPISAIMCDGTIIDSIEDYKEFHDEWFEDDQWNINHQIVAIEETPQMAYAVTEGDYFDKDEDGESYNLSLVTTCIMRKVEGKWVMIHFQQTETQLDD